MRYRRSFISHQSAVWCESPIQMIHYVGTLSIHYSVINSKCHAFLKKIYKYGILLHFYVFLFTFMSFSILPFMQGFYLFFCIKETLQLLSISSCVHKALALFKYSTENDNKFQNDSLTFTTDLFVALLHTDTGNLGII